MAIQKSSKVCEVNSPALSTRMILMGWSGNCALSLRMWAKSLGKTKLRVESKDTWDHLEDAQVMTRKNRKGPLGGSIGPHTSACNCSKNLGIAFIVLAKDGLNTSLPFEHARQGTLWSGRVLGGMPLVAFKILWNIFVPGCPKRLCQVSDRVLACASI